MSPFGDIRGLPGVAQPSVKGLTSSLDFHDPNSQFCLPLALGKP